ncbi:hypothetical protein [Streptomyces tendae]|uniref:hypothetical protein n=1 Tax=Streptomyces tendae TaxID=1932 RepID=UPI00366913CA
MERLDVRRAARRLHTRLDQPPDPLLAKFFAQITEKNLLAPGGEIHVIASNTADLRALVQHALDHGLSPRIDHLHDWQDGVLTFLFRITHDTPRTGGRR